MVELRLGETTHTEQYAHLQALYQMAVELSGLRSLESVQDTALKHCLNLTGSQFGFIGLNTPDSKALEVVAIQGFHPDRAFFQHNRFIPLRPNIFARVVLEDRPIRSEDATIDPRRVGQPDGHPPVITFLGVPLRLRDAPIGMIGVANRPQPYEDEHIQLLTTYAAQVSIAIHNAQLYEQLTSTLGALEQKVARRTRQLEEAKEALSIKAAQLQKLLTETFDVQEQERQRIAQDMHDGTTQLLIGAMLELKSAQRRLDNQDLSLADESLKQVRAILHQVEAEMKRVIYDLRPPTLDALGLVPAVRRYAERFEQYSGIRCQVAVFGETARLSPRVEIGVYRLIQEALQNVSLHAQADLADVVIAFTPRNLKLSIIDNGQGFDLEQVRRNQNEHLGLLGMRERAESMGGRIAWQTTPGQGVHLELLVPIEASLEIGNSGPDTHPDR